MKCKHCKKEYDPSFDFIEDIETYDALICFADINELCSNCCWKLVDELVNTSKEFLNETDS